MRRLGRRAVIAGALAVPTVARAQDSPASLRDLARRATIYLFPVYEMYRTRWRATVDETNPLRQRLNRFRHLETLADDGRPTTTPNADTLYSTAWLDLSAEPLFLTVPPVGDLYYSYAFLDLRTDNFAVVSHRLQGGRPPTQMIVGPAWKGDASSEVALIRSPTNSVWLIGRIVVDAPDELDRARILQGRVLLETPDMRNERRILETRELMRQRTQAPPEPVADWPAAHPSEPFDLFDVGMRALAESPLPERDRPLLEALAPLKLKPGRKFDRRGFVAAERRAILAGIEQGHADIRAASGRAGRTILVHRGNHVMWYHLGIKRRENVVISDHIANAVSYTYHCHQEYLLDQHVQVDHRYLSLPVLQESLQEENSNIIIFRYLEQ